mmetsp:Transcript_1711/g.3730  ORF Transcript_1711/g.3730 Transcript_1711/m.3730 type:complete len:100 (-) Transcript_1711:22-321(-)
MSSSAILQSYTPALKISCADALAEYAMAKKASPRPLESNVVTTCYHKTMESLKDTPCAKIQSGYAECLEKNAGRKKNTMCIKFIAPLEECTAKHVGKLD